MTNFSPERYINKHSPLTINLSIPYHSYSNLSKNEHGYWVLAPTLLILRQGGIQSQVRFLLHELRSRIPQPCASALDKIRSGFTEASFELSLN
jgi:hypothetical protein